MAPVTAEEPTGNTKEPSKLAIRVEPITDIWPGNGGAGPGIGKVYRGEIYFAAHNRGDGRDIWRFDGNRTAIAIETDRAAFAAAVGVEMVFKDRLLYTLPQGKMRQLWEYDGETSRQIGRAAVPWGEHAHFAEYRGALYFSGVDPERGVELWKYDSTVASLVSDIRPGSESSSPRFMTVYQEALYFFANDGTHGRELWHCDETSTELIADIDPGIWEGGRPRDSRVFDSLYNGGVVYQDKFVFGAASERTGYELCAWDGKRVAILADINPGPDGSFCGNLCLYKDELYFSASHATSEDGAAHRRELWKYDGDKAMLVANGGPDGKWKSVGVLGAWNDFLILVADDGEHGPEPWCYDGYAVQMIADAWPGPQGSFAAFRTNLGEQGIGEGRFPDRGLELFRLIEAPPKEAK